MTHPYRDGRADDDARDLPATNCLFCRLRAAIARIGGRSLVLGGALVLLLATNAATALAARATLRDAAKALDRARATERAAKETLQRSKMPRPVAPPTAHAEPGPCIQAPGDERDGIFRLNAREFYVNRSSIDRALERSASGLGPLRVLPERKSGAVVGVRLFGLDANSILGMLGIEDGDTLQTVNGFEIATPERALEAYARLRLADELELRLVRRGSTVLIRYHIVS